MDINEKKFSRFRIIIGSLIILGIIIAIALVIMFWGDADKDGENSDSFFGILVNLIEEQPSGNDQLRGGVIIGENAPEEEKMVLYQISKEPVVGATLSPDGTHVRYFKQTSGHLFETEFTGANEIRISNVTIPAILDVDWTGSKTYAVINYYTDGETRRLYSHYNGTTTVSSAFLPNNIQEITTSQVDDMIAYTVFERDNTILFTARPNNTSIKNIATLPVPDFELSWPAAGTIALKQKSSAYAPSFLFTLNPSSKLLTRILAEKEGLDVLWSPNGNRMLFMETTNEGTQTLLSVTTLIDNNIIALPFVTLPEKCVWAPASNNILYCAVPETIPRGTNLPDEWWQGTISFDDILWYINIDTGERRQILPPHQLDAVHLFLSKDESFIFFTNKKDGTLWSLRLASQNP